MPSEWPTRRWQRVRVAEDHMIRVLSREAEARRVPSFENFTHDTAFSWSVRVFR